MKESQKITIAVIALIALIGGLIGGIVARAPKQDAADKEYEAYYAQRYDTVLLPVDDVKYVSSYEVPDESSYVDQMMMIHPEQIIHKWATNYINNPQRFRTACRFYDCRCLYQETTVKTQQFC